VDTIPPQSLQNESQSETGDFYANPNYSLSENTYSDTSDNNSSSLDGVNVSALDEPRNIDFTPEKHNRKANSRKTTVPSEWKRNETNFNKNPTRCNSIQIFIYCEVTLHVSGVTAPIIRSTKNCNRSLRYRS